MARFLVKASEFKNVCKAVNDRKLAELKKEIIEILKKQDEKDVKKAIDYFNSQEEHYTHLEKSLISGKWIQKAGYGVGTVRIWKGKKYKKIAPGKWARVFDKEGRGTNIAIGKLIAKVQKIENVEDLMAFVMQNKQRFVDENGIDLPVLDKLRAAVGVKNENLSGESSSYTYGVGEDVSREKNKIFEGKEKITKEEADLHKVSRKFEQIPTTELKQRKSKLERWIENKTRNKRDSLNNAIFRESYQKELDAINAVLDKRSNKVAEKHQNRSDAMKENKNAVKVGGDKKVIGTFTKKDDNSVEMDATKENKVIFDSLNKALSKDKTRAFMTDVYYDGEYLNSTNGYSLVSVKVGDIGLDKGFVKVDSNNGKINVSAIPDKHSDYIPPYKTVIPENNNQKVNIDNKKLKQKLKAMKAEGAYTKDNPIIALEFKDGNVVLDDTVIGKSDAKFADDKDAIYFVADNLSNMITNNKDSTMFVSDNPEKAIAFSDDSSDIVLMPAKETVLNYEGRRNIKKENDEYEAKTKQRAQDALNSIVDTQKDSMNNEWVQNLINQVNNKEMEKHKEIIEHSYKALKDAEKMIEKPTKKWTSSLANNRYGYSLLAAVRKNPDFKTALENMAMEYGLIKKSLFDDFIVDVFEANDEDELEQELYEGETEYNDYSAEQPELFNSTAMKVREALDRIRNQVL